MGILRFAGVFTVALRKSELKISEANAGIRRSNTSFTRHYL